jgi:hypothetical protein
MTDSEIAELLDAVDTRIRRATRQAQAYGVVTQTSPLRVRLNDDTADVPVDLQLAGTAVVGDTVGLVRLGRDWASLGAIDTDWQTPTFQNDWAEYADANYGTVRYRKVGGLVFIRGLIADGTLGAVAFTLPVGYRPAQHHIFASVSAGAFVELRVLNNGDVLPLGGNTAWFSVRCQFVAEG